MTHHSGTGMLVGARSVTACLQASPRMSPPAQPGGLVVPGLAHSSLMTKIRTTRARSVAIVSIGLTSFRPPVGDEVPAGEEVQPGRPGDTLILRRGCDNERVRTTQRHRWPR